MEEKKVDLVYPSNVAELFMAVYVLRNVKDNFILFSVDFKEHLDEIMLNYFENLKDPEESLKAFYECFSKSKSKKYFADAFKYDFEKNMLVAEADINTAASIVSKYNLKSVNMIDLIVREFEKHCKSEEKKNGNSERKYIKLGLSKAMTECGNSNSN